MLLIPALLFVATLGSLQSESSESQPSALAPNPFPEQSKLLYESLQKLGIPDDSIPRIQFYTQLGGFPGSNRTVITDGDIRVFAQNERDAAFGAAEVLRSATFHEGQVQWSDRFNLNTPHVDFRCFMVDMGRNPHPPEVLRRVVDMLWFHRVNYLQLHLTDDQLCSWPSEEFPKLADERAGWTLKDFMELERYSQVRGVTIIPEIDVPGHSSLLRKHYPEVFGKTTTELATLASAQKGVEALITELLTVFQATPYVHIGGDEAYGVPQATQRDFINRLNAFIKSKHRRTIVWEGPGLGEGNNKVSTDVMHMNWRCIEFPAQDMLDAGYSVVNASWDPFYIVDHYPRTMFTAVDLKRCFEWNVKQFAHVNHEIATFAQPHITRTDKGIVGFCMPYWEGRPENLFALCEPRLAAVAETSWNRPTSFEAFLESRSRSQATLAKVSGITFEPPPVSTRAEQAGNLAFLAQVRTSQGSHQPHFGPDRLTNGVTARFDHFLGFPTQPEPLEIFIDFEVPTSIARITVFEDATADSYEVYELFVRSESGPWEQVGMSGKGVRGTQSFVDFAFEAREVKTIKVATQGCHGLTFPSFSRLAEVKAFAR